MFEVNNFLRLKKFYSFLLGLNAWKTKHITMQKFLICTIWENDNECKLENKKGSLFICEFLGRRQFLWQFKRTERSLETPERSFKPNFLLFCFLLFSFQMDQRVNIKPHESQLQFPSITTDLLLQLFPFAFLLDHDMRVCGAGDKIMEAWSANNNYCPPASMMGIKLTDYFKVRRPLGINFDWDTVSHLTTVLFEIQLLRQVSAKANKLRQPYDVMSKIEGHYELPGRNRRGSQGLRTILLKGEMMYLKDNDTLIFLCSPL